jgi:hypothetical protein
MAKKNPPKPLLTVKFEFVEALDNVVAQSINLITLCESILEHEQIKTKGIADMLRERLDAFRKAMLTDG